MDEDDDINSVKRDVNNLCINACGMEDIATTTVPRVIMVSDGSAKGVFCNLFRNYNTEVLCEKMRDPVSIFKLARFLLPRQDLPFFCIRIAEVLSWRRIFLSSGYPSIPRTFPPTFF